MVVSSSSLSDIWWPHSLAREVLASSSLPLNTSHTGDSGDVQIRRPAMAGAAVLRSATCLQYTWSLVRSKGRNIPKVLAAPARVCTVVLSSGEEVYR